MMDIFKTKQAKGASHHISNTVNELSQKAQPKGVST